ncbi:DUF3718 domain-containing protein [Colwelliaceae bacterium 6441]
MNKVKPFTAIAFIFFTGASFSSLAMDKYIEEALIDICKVSTKNSIIKFHKAVRSYRLKDRTVATKVVCNGENISDFARNRGSFKVAAKLEKSVKGTVSITDVAAISKINVNFVE